MAKRRLGDRYDGKKIRKADPFFFVMPHIMKDRCDAQVFFETKIDMAQVDLLLQKLRQEQDLPVKFLHLLLTAFVRTLAAKPVLNRFVRGGKIFARNSISLSLTIKKEMREQGDEGVIKVQFDPQDTLYDVMDRFQKAVDECMAEEDSQNDTDAFVKVLRSLPAFLIRFVVWTVTKLDNLGIMPKFIHNLSPFHTSAYLTDLGSLRIDPVYHHIYNFGTTSVFCAFGMRRNEMHVKADGTPVVRRYMTLRLVLDERIADGFNMAAALHHQENLLKHPEQLLEPPQEVAVDPGV